MFAIVDLETTGGKPSQDRVTEIAIIIHNGKRVIEHYTSLVNPGKPIDPFVVALTGISDDMVADAPSFADIADKVDEMTRNHILVAHNARFDYGILRLEYKRLERNFQRKQLCTVKLARKIFPDLPSYSLGKLCRSLDIPLEGRHRAYGDAFATTVLLEKLIFNDRGELIESELKEGLEDYMLPQHFSREQLEELPEEAGVYYFTDSEERILYVGKSKNIRKRVYQHFINDLHPERFAALKREMANIRYQLTGTELIAMLLESSEIKRFMPKFNKAQKSRKYRAGLYLQTDDEGFKYLQVGGIRQEEKPVIKCTHKRVAERLLENLMEKYHLDGKEELIRKIKRTKGTDALRRVHNDNVENAVSNYYFPWRNFFLIDEAPNPDELSVIWVEDSVYKGFGFYNPEYTGKRPDELMEVVQFQYDNPDVQRILRAWLRRNKKKAKVITYDL